MRNDPLEAPGPDSEVLATFLGLFGLEGRARPSGPSCESPPPRLLVEVATAFSRIPYENLTKIIKHAACESPEPSRRFPLEVVEGHARWGSGGTCFSLTACLLHVVRALGWRAEPILADRPYGPDTHSALLVWIDGEPHLLDPGYLILEPLSLEGLASAGAGPRRVETTFNDLLLEPRHGGERIDLSTVQAGGPTGGPPARPCHRLTFKMRPADPGEFLRAWDASFGWDMMRYPLLTRVVSGRQLYLHNQRLQVRDRNAVAREDVPLDDLSRVIEARFGLRASIASTALRILRARGELHVP